MRLVMMIAALGFVLGAPIAPTGVMNKAEAQANTSVSTEQRQLQAQLTALARAGNTDGIKALIALKIQQGKAGMVAKVAKAIARSGASLAASDATGAAALVNAAILIAGDPAVTAADSTVTQQVALTAGIVIATLWNSSGAQVNDVHGGQSLVARNATQLAAMNSIVNAVNASSNSNFRNTVYSNAPSGGKKALDANRPQNNQQTGGGTGGTQQTGSTTNSRTRTTNTNTVEVPEVPEPNPSQAGSPT